MNQIQEPLTYMRVVQVDNLDGQEVNSQDNGQQPQDIEIGVVSSNDGFSSQNSLPCPVLSDIKPQLDCCSPLNDDDQSVQSETSSERENISVPKIESCDNIQLPAGQLTTCNLITEGAMEFRNPRPSSEFIDESKYIEESKDSNYDLVLYKEPVSMEITDPNCCPMPPAIPTLVTCSICLEEFTESYDVAYYASCSYGTQFCTSCIANYIVTSINAGKLQFFNTYYYGLKCPCSNLCSGFIYDHQMTGLAPLNPEIMVKIENRKAELSASRSHLARYCPHKDCPSHGSSVVLMAHPNQWRVQCSHCSKSFCAMCQQPDHHVLNFPSCLYHRGSISVTSYRGQTNPLWNAITGKSSDGCQGMKKCPNCHAWIEKNGGCPHMHCHYCQYDFCWDCEGAYSGGCENKRKLAGLPHAFGCVWNAPAWGSNMISRAVTKTIGIPTALGLAVAGGVLFIAGLIVFGVTVVPITELHKYCKRKLDERRRRNEALNNPNALHYEGYGNVDNHNSELMN